MGLMEGMGRNPGLFFSFSGGHFTAAGPGPDFMGRSGGGQGMPGFGQQHGGGRPVYFEEVSDEDDYYDSEEDDDEVDDGGEYQYYKAQQQRERARQEAQERERQRVRVHPALRALACHVHGQRRLLLLSKGTRRISFMQPWGKYPT